MLSVAQADAERKERPVPGGVHGVQEEGHGDPLQMCVVLLERLWVLHAGLIFNSWERPEGLFKASREIGFYLGPREGRHRLAGVRELFAFAT